MTGFVCQAPPFSSAPGTSPYTLQATVDKERERETAASSHSATSQGYFLKANLFRTHKEKMVSAGFQMLGSALGIIGWIGAIVVCALPMWKVTAFIGSNIVTSQTSWEGIWMNCVVQSTGQMQCKVYDSMLALSQDLQAARALCIISIIVGIFGILLSVAGGKCTNCVEDERAKAKVGVAAGVVYIIAGALVLIPVCWTAHTIIQDFYNPLVVQAQKRELGAALYIGWGAAALMLIGGGMLCCNCPKGDDDTGYTAKYSAARSQASAPSSKDYV